MQEREPDIEQENFQAHLALAIDLTLKQKLEASKREHRRCL